MHDIEIEQLDVKTGFLHEELGTWINLNVLLCLT
jgi:hypothetical protein